MSFFARQLFWTMPYPTADCIGKTVIVTGSNVGLGLEAARHFVRLNASKVILGVRTVKKGEAAKIDIETSTKRKDVCEVWELDLESNTSVKQFAARVATLPRVDILVANASIAAQDYRKVEGRESTITVNVINTALLVLLVLPTFRQSAQKYNIKPTISVVSSAVHGFTTFPERTAENIFTTLSDERTANMYDRYVKHWDHDRSSLTKIYLLHEFNLKNLLRYNVSKLLQILIFRELSARTEDTDPRVTINIINPGLCQSSLARNVRGLIWFRIALLKALIARTTEQGSRTLVHAATQGPETHGLYISDCYILKDKYALFH